MSDELAVDYERLRYIELRGDGSKLPKRQWGGYSQDFDEAEHVYTHEEVKMMPGREWGVVDVEDIEGASMSLLIFDIDAHKAPDGFEFDRVEVPNDTLVVKSQNGGLHVYFKLNGYRRGDLQESDFMMTAKLPFDIDIRGSSVTHHVVAPGDIPGVGGDYEIVNNEKIKPIGRPTEGCERITLDGKPLLEFDQRTDIGDFEFDRPTESPEDMPKCYHAGLELRKAAPDDHPNTHKVNVLTALCGLGAGYSVEEVVDHFVNEYAPDDGEANHCDVDKTTYQVKHLARNLDSGHYSPPAESTLRDYGIFEEGESCDSDCPIEYHGGKEEAKFDVVVEYDEERDVGDVAEAEAVAVAGEETVGADADAEAETDGGAATATSSAGEAPPQSRFERFERDVVEAISEVNEDDDLKQRTARHRIAKAFDEYYNFVYPEDDVRGWRSTLYVYNDEEGVYEPRGEAFVKMMVERAAGDYVTNQVTNEIVGKLERMTVARGDQFRTDPHRLVVANGILNLHNGDLDDWTPTEYHRTKLDIRWNPDVGNPEEIDEFLQDIVEPGDVDTLYRLVAHTIYKEYVTEKAAMLVGSGQNGKSVFLDLVEQFLGEYNVSHRSLQAFEDKFAANQLEGKLANIHPDMGDESVKDMSTFKKLTGRDTMTADVKYETPIVFENYATLIFAANEMPVFGEDNHAVWRRWVYVNFPYTFDETDPSAKDPEPKRVLMRRLTQEKEFEALLVRCQEEIQAWYEGREWYPDAMQPDEVREQMKKAAEPVYDFAMTCLRENDEDDAFLPKDQVRKCYREYATEEGLPKMGEEQFGEKLVNLRDLTIENGRRTKNNVGYTYEGVEFTERGRQVLGIDEPDASDDQETVDDLGGAAKPVVLETLRNLVEENDYEAVSEDMVIGAAMTKISMSRAQNALEELKRQGDVYEPATGKVIDT